jgi:hypothetical protein
LAKRRLLDALPPGARRVAEKTTDPSKIPLVIDNEGFRMKNPQMWDMASVRLAYAAHQLAKTEMSIELPTDMITAASEAEIAAVLIESADDLQQYSLNILA